MCKCNEYVQKYISIKCRHAAADKRLRMMRDRQVVINLSVTNAYLYRNLGHPEWLLCNYDFVYVTHMFL